MMSCRSEKDDGPELELATREEGEAAAAQEIEGHPPVLLLMSSDTEVKMNSPG
jgi:hypothetical protein